MNSYKIKLIKKLSDTVAEVFENAKLMNSEENNSGFFCDYELSEVIKPESFALIKSKMNETENGEKNRTFEIDSFSGVYENNDAKNKMLQRIYVKAFESSEKFHEYKKLMEEAALCDHKNLGAKLKLFLSSAEIGQGLVLWHPKGGILRYLTEQFGQKAHILNDYQWVYSPHIGRSDLWRTSGHLDFYRDSMYSPIVIDDDEYYLKPMNCPFHIGIYNSEPRSYKALPFRMAEYGTVYRYELSGALNGLTRVRGFTQDDAHIICTEEQVESEVKNALLFSLYILKSFGFNDFTAYISTKPEKKFIGEDSDWERATNVLKDAVTSAGLEYKTDEGGGAFYGPKIDLKLNDFLGREWQCSTIQFDFNLPLRFDMRYIDRNGKAKTPVMVHRALFGSVERFLALIIEQYRGDFPFWLSPVQIGIVPIKEKHNEYAENLYKKLKRLDLRVSLNKNDDNMRKKIKDFELEKVPYILITGDRETETNTFSLRSHKNGDLGSFNIEKLIDFLKPEINLGVPKYIFD